MQHESYKTKIKALVEQCLMTIRENFLLPFSASRVYLYLLTDGPFSHLKSQQHISSKSLSLILILLPPFYKDPCDFIGSTG